MASYRSETTLINTRVSIEFEKEILLLSVYNIRCHDTNSLGGAEVFTAVLKKPDGFKGHPIFAENRNIRAAADEECQIREDKTNPSNVVYRLKVSDYVKCPVERKNEFVSVRIWFPQLDGIVMADDQDVVVRCKPPLAIVTEQKVTSFSGSMPPSGRVSGVVEGDPGELVYNIGLYQESTPRSNNFDLDVEEIVPIGTMLQLRANINNKSAWKYVKLLEVTVSADENDPYHKGHITLVKNGCRVKEYDTIVPNQPKRPADNTAEVSMNFQAFLLDNTEENGKLWIHTQIKACLEATDCLAEFCLDLYQPSGHGRKRRSSDNSTGTNRHARKSDSTSIGENIGITVSLPGTNSFDFKVFKDNFHFNLHLYGFFHCNSRLKVAARCVIFVITFQYYFIKLNLLFERIIFRQNNVFDYYFSAEDSTFKKLESMETCTSFLALTAVLAILLLLSICLSGILYRHIQRLRIESKLLPIYLGSTSKVVDRKNFNPKKETIECEDKKRSSCRKFRLGHPKY
ncbi:uncharacterized protein LOC111638168 [Centruroides sculpturatus]|uniref:uncharacterized protein LOC111638168 n=1 Tax=Centruroides sculpturatus TaxID=218467 RepID=UPI000C6D8677|nr:uncharacterized protein LOC111638168 [Centruroides sculpturatus]